MPREIITIQVGQCGNQIALKFWELALQEHIQQQTYDESMSSFFLNGSQQDDGFENYPVGSEINDIKARAIVVDMENGVIDNKILGGELGDIFDSQFCISDQSGAGNNWAHGHFYYGNEYHDSIQETIQKSAEKCDSLEGFFFTHSLGGGTGSGLGTSILKNVGDNYSKEFKFSTCVFPSPENDDVNVSPYNSMLALNVLIEHADCVMPVENQQLYEITQRLDMLKEKQKAKGKNMMKEDAAVTDSKGKGHHFERENTIVAHVINNMTSSMRFDGSLNVDMNEITMNLVPYPRMHFLVSALSPLYQLLDKGCESRSIDQSFLDSVDPHYQLVKTDPSSSLYLATGLIVRSKQIEIYQVNRGVEALQNKIDMIYWNKEGFKVGICKKPPKNQDYSILSLCNSTGIKQTFSKLKSNFDKLYKHKAFLQNYKTYGADEDVFDQARENCASLIEDYKTLESEGRKSISEEEIDSMRFQPLV